MTPQTQEARLQLTPNQSAQSHRLQTTPNQSAMGQPSSLGQSNRVQPSFSQPNRSN